MQGKIWSYEEIDEHMSEPLKGLRCLCLFTENFSVIRFLPRDIHRLCLNEPTHKFPCITSSPELNRFLTVTGASLCLRPEADNFDRIDNGPDLCYGGLPSSPNSRWVPLFERIQRCRDIVYLNFGYGEGAMESDCAEDFIEVSVPFLGDPDYSEPHNLLQTTWKDKQGCLHIEIQPVEAYRSQQKQKLAYIEEVEEKDDGCSEIR